MDLMWTDFLNSIWRDWRGTGKPPEDRLVDSEWQSYFLNKWELEAKAPANKNELEALGELRSFLQQLTEKLALGGQVNQQDVDHLNLYLKQSPVIRSVVKNKDGEGWHEEFLSTQKGWQRVSEAITTSFIHTVMNGSIDRIKICDNKDCLWVFYDSTRNHSKRYCDDKACGNLLKVRKFRERKKNKTELATARF